MDMQDGIKCLVLPMDSSFTGALRKLQHPITVSLPALPTVGCASMPYWHSWHSSKKSEKEKKTTPTPLVLLFFLGLFLANIFKLQ